MVTTMTRRHTPSTLDALLVAQTPRPDLADKLQLFGQFVGSWRLEVVNHARDGTSTTIPGEWHFGWALDGRAVADVWIAPSREHREATGQDGEWGLTVRFYDPAIDAWRSTWLGPKNGVVMPFVARPVGDEIVLEGSFQEGTATRWIFSDVAPDSFRWRNEHSEDGGRTWRLQQEMRAVRASGFHKVD